MQISDNFTAIKLSDRLRNFLKEINKKVWFNLACQDESNDKYIKIHVWIIKKF